ncbi:MAG TPA: LamG-like jellyroll fold domain-containing protein, partial [Verrucomicrobiae bacterium]|nr:LamG-like jellyroll fold domain-containing protein [Verrucomicrobiae bacterium]
VTVFPGERDKAVASLQQLGAEVVAEDSTPFGPVLTVKPHPDTLVALAQLAEVQRIEYANPRALLNDLTRVRVGVSTDTVVTNNYLDLTGSNVVVNINDSGVDATHPALELRVSTTVPNPFTLTDPNGHGTHVAGTIAGNGAQSSVVADGSVTNANFRGKAPAAGLFVLPIDLQTGPLISDAFLHETAATNNYMTRGRTNPIISNNSWGYINAFEYNASSASFDAAVRDALPSVIGSQPVLYVFAAGNSGFGTTNGTVGESDTILSPATAKNVITVGAVENRRGLTNDAFAGFTDSNNEIASFSSRGNTGVGTEGEFGRFKPDVVAPGTFIVSTRSLSMTVDPAFPDLGPLYRYETGTSMAAPAVSGVLALMQEFFERKLSRGFSAALMKALLINGARPVNPNYDLQVRTPLNFQGWGLVNLTNSLPSSLTNTSGTASWPVQFVDQSPDNALATGESHTWNLTLSTNAQFVPLRVTLVWTDPPGNPSAGIKLVNDLDLVVSNRVSGEVFVGNNFPDGSDFTSANDTNAPAARDFVNNVENAFLSAPLTAAYAITVTGRRVNVNAVTANTNNVVQDYALVISSGNGQVTNAFATFVRQVNRTEARSPATGLTNGVPLLEERVGANFQLAPSTNGAAAQWNFYAFTNALFTNNPSGLNNGSNVAFVTFLPPNLSRGRNLDADIDLYVSTNSQLINLVPGVVAGAFKSRNRGGTELVIFTNAAIGIDSVFYIGVKSEDQQAAEYGIAAFSTDVPFESTDPNGNVILRGVPPNALIPDGSPGSPGFVPVFAFGISDNQIARVVVTNEITHQSVGDLLGNLSHEDQFAVLNNHNLFGGSANGFYRIVYDDSSAGQFFFSRHTDGPGTLNNFAGQSSSGVWLLTMSDDSLNRTGLVNSFSVRVEPQRDLLGGGVTNSVLANQWNYYFVDVPPGASSLTVILSSTDGPLELYLRQGALPTTTDYDKRALIDPTGGSLSIGLGDVPPLNAGRYFIGVFNPTAQTVNYVIRVMIDTTGPAIAAQTFVSTNPPPPLVDDAISRSSMMVTNNRPVTDLEVAVRIDHVRASDLVLHLVNPQGERVLLAENRGGPSPSGYGLSLFTTNFLAATNSGGSAETSTTYNVGTNKGTLKIDYDFGGAEADILRVYYDAIRIFDSGPTFGVGTFTVNFGPGISTNITIVVNEGSPPRPTPSVWRYSAYILTDLRMVYTVFSEDTNVTLAPIKFGVAPFATGGGISTNLLFTNSFEGAVADTYCAVTNFDGWQVVSNQVGVVNDPAVSHTGTNYLALFSGHTFLTLPTLAGQQYRLRHVYRSSPPDLSLVSWWPGNGNAIDIADGNSGSLAGGISFGGGMVGEAFTLDGVDDHVIIPASTNLHVRSVTFDAWILPSDLSVARPILEYANASGPSGAHFWIGPSAVPPFFGSGKLFMNFRYDNLPGDVPPYKVVESDPGLIKTNEWQHVAATYDQASGEARLYLNGEVVGATNLGGFLPATTFQNVFIGRRPLTSPDGSAGASFAGKIDEVDVWNRALSPNEIRAIYLAGSLGKCGAQTFKHPTPVSLWPAEGTAADFVDGNPGTLVGGVTYATGMVGRAFSFNGTGEVLVNNNANLNPQRLTLEAWVFPTPPDGEMETILYKEDDSGLPAQYAMAIKGPTNISCVGSIPTGNFAFALVGVNGMPSEFCGWVDGGGSVPTDQWTHLAVTFDGNSAKAYINGRLTRNITNLSGNINVSTGPLRIGSRSPAIVNTAPQERFNGRIDETSLYDRALDGCEIQAIYHAGSFGKYSLAGRLAPCDVDALVIVDGRLTNSAIGTLNWQTNTVDFTATQNGTPVLLVGDRPEMWFDTFELFELRGLNTYYLPEEPMKPLLGQPATGTWTLEVWDNRVGGLIATPPIIVSWELRLTLSNTNPPAILLTNFPPAYTNIYSVFDTNGVPATVCVSDAEIKYFMVDVPRRATMATNVLGGAGDLV